MGRLAPIVVEKASRFVGIIPNMKPLFWKLILIMGIGLLLMMLPDPGKPVFYFSPSHGPSLLDLLGLSLILFSWFWMIANAWVKRKSITLKLGVFLLMLLLAIHLGGLYLVYYYIRNDASYGWMIGAGISLIAILPLIILSFRK